MIRNFLYSLINFCYIIFLAKLLKLDIFFSTAVRALVVAKLVILEISPLTSFILVLREALVAKLVISGILFSIFDLNILNLSIIFIFLATSFFTTSLSLIKSTGGGTLLFILLKATGNFLICQYLICLH